MKAGDKKTTLRTPVSGLGGWLLRQFQKRWRATAQAKPRLALIERITLAPRQSLALVEAEGRRLLIATSAEGAPVFYALDCAQRSESRRAARIS